MNIRALALAVLASVTVSVHAADWPDKTVRIVVPYPPGGNVDVAARIIAPGLEKEFGQTFVVENRAGAGGLIAGEYVARAEPDGSTLFMAANGPLLFSPIIFNRPVYHWKTDFAPISTVSLTPMVMQVSPSLKVDSFAAFIDYAKKNPGKLNMASPGAGTSNHLMSEMLQKKTGAKWLTVHYKGNAPATTDLIGGQVDFNFDQVSVALPFIKEGKLKPLAVTSAKRVPSLPDVPTMEEVGLDGLVAYTFTGLLAPNGTPDDVIQRLSAALKTILAQPEIIEKFQKLGAEAHSATPQDFQAYLETEDKRWVPIIEQAGITAK
ncbi:Bug family tripartite tricarboxylate transporter substrate binding protein [Allopusillimonas ginsengisoli]|uniref:Bug family tripartite tricarboxylate transporter substrate binding protein n=1 Tax=Allopusillimonas ginsengisoli TaxID=453575 RepID=UPI0010C1FD7D|nr:tripartite tricarboxylate transporter substrate binding protein [Allopusillimonas ginsengisoli]